MVGTRNTGALYAGGRVAVYRTQKVLAAYVTGRVAAARPRLNWSNSRFAAMWLGGLRPMHGRRMNDKTSERASEGAIDGPDNDPMTREFIPGRVLHSRDGSRADPT